MTLKERFHDYSLKDLQSPQILRRLDEGFLSFIHSSNPSLHKNIVQYRQAKPTFTPIEKSDIIIATAKALEAYLAVFFDIEQSVEHAQLSTLKDRPIFAFKKWFVLRRAKRRLSRKDTLPTFAELDQWLTTKLNNGEKKRELAVAQFAVSLLETPEQHENDIEQLTLWCIQAIKTDEGREATADWMSFNLPKPLEYQHLIPIVPVKGDTFSRKVLPRQQCRHRDGFKLTDPRMNQEQVESEIDYCLYCHDHDGDFCSKGFPLKKGEPEKGFRKNPLGNTLTGCPLDEKISEMITLKRDGFTLGALATIMIDNPMCPATGHRICNDCMKACIYQKQHPVDIPEIETQVLTDTLSLPYGVEIYDLLTRWNPLRATQWAPKPYNNFRIFIAGLGPAGFTLAHHLLMDGCAVVGTDGLKIEPLPESLLTHPIKHFSDITESLDERIMTGFGGVAEYGITVRWDKNFLKLIYINLRRRTHFLCFGGVRFGGTVQVDDLWKLGFDHAVIAVGAGLPKALPIPGSMAKGMRQANDFLMTLQLTGASKKTSLAPLQLRMPVVVIGGGLTAVDAATEAQAYYLAQVEKTLVRYERLVANADEKTVRATFSKEDLMVLDEFLTHGRAVRKERIRAEKLGVAPNFISLLHRWGGVTLLYRRNIQDSPAYISNHTELYKALEEGLYYAEGVQPKAATLDEYHAITSLACTKRLKDKEGIWHNTDETTVFPAKSVLVATGAQPNIAYTFEHPDVFKRNGLEYQPYEMIDDQLTIVKRADNLKEKNFGPFTSYDKRNKQVSFIGDTHPVFHGNVVSAIASALRTYPKIMALFAGKTAKKIAFDDFKASMQHHFHTYVKSIQRRSDNIVEIEVHAPMAVKQYQPGQFFRVQNYETLSQTLQDTLLQTTPTALLGFEPDEKRETIKLVVVEHDANSKLFANFKPNDPIAFMGPTGVRTKITEDQENILIIGDNPLSLAYVRAVGRELRDKKNKVIYIANFETADALFCQEEIEACTDQVFWSTLDDSNIPCNREQDRYIHGTAIDALLAYQQAEDPLVALNAIDRITVHGSTALLKQFQKERHNTLQGAFKDNIKVFGSIYTTMQCMLKGVCAQCLQWQINPETGQRTKAVFGCSWQDQPLELVDLDNLSERLLQNHCVAGLNNLWYRYIVENG